MQALPEPLRPLARFAQFVLWKAVAPEPPKTKIRKIPINPHTGRAFVKGEDWQQDPSKWADADHALTLASRLGPEYGVGFLIKQGDPFFFLDLDNCLTDGAWSPLAMSLMQTLQGAAVEVSTSGNGLHIIGTGALDEHGCRNDALGLELYTGGRFIALTGDRAIGNADADVTAQLKSVATQYFTPREATASQDWTGEPVAEWTGTTDDNKLLEQALASTSATGVFAGRASFRDLWECNTEVLEQCYPGDDGYNASAVDAALAQHLMFWTGKNCERAMLLMWRSALVRDKWARDDYLHRTLLNAAAMQGPVYSVPEKSDTVVDPVADKHGAVRLKGPPSQKQYAEQVRAEKLAACGDDEALQVQLCPKHGPLTTAAFWLDNKNTPPADLAAQAAPIEAPRPVLCEQTAAELLLGYQFLSAQQQIEHFAGCVYVQELNQVFTPSGSLLKKEQFNVVYGGYSFQTEADGGGKTTKKAWDVFTESQAVRFPKAMSLCFRPELPTGAIFTDSGVSMVNTYVPIETPCTPGDVTPFLEHLAKVLPGEHDREILLAYMAACIQYKGTKFKWAPLLQGVEGNGKSLFSHCVRAAIGDRYSHLPPANEISEKFNSWLFNTLFIGVEDIFVPEHKREIIEILKPMVTEERMARRAMQTDQVMHDVRANFIFNSNHKDAVRKTRNDRRFAIFYTAQQVEAHLARDGMGGDYFPKLYEWLKRQGGYAHVTHYLTHYQIPDALNPAGACHRAPDTSSTDEAIKSSLGGIEQEILEAIDEGRPGFAGGWVSSMALERLLRDIHAARTLPHNKRRDVLQQLGYDWHPALREGRANNHVGVDGGKPRLFIKQGHISANLQTPAEVIRAYEAAQGNSGVVSAAAQVFGSEK